MKEQNNQEKKIRFITSGYKDLFRIQAGGTIQVTFPDRQFVQKCEHIDDYHTRIGNYVYQICQYAEMLEQNGGRCEPEPELRDLEIVLSRAVEYGHWKRDIDQAKTIEAVRDVRYGICESENLNLTREQVDELHILIDRKEAEFAKETMSISKRKAIKRSSVASHSFLKLKSHNCAK